MEGKGPPSIQFRQRGPLPGRATAMDQTLVIGIMIASVLSAVVTTVYAVIVRVLWRRGKSLREP
jgi:hypothetical protein